jgi:hypothetical protein
MAQESRAEPFKTPERPAPSGKMTYEEFLGWADEDTRAEWVNGKVVILSPASLRHQQLATFLATSMNFFVDAHQLGVVLTPPFQMKTGHDLPGREPDIMFVAREHLDRFRDTYLDGPADLVVEIISRDSRARDRGDKFYEYEQGGCGSTGCSTTYAGRRNFTNWEQMVFTVSFLLVPMASIIVLFWKAYGSMWNGSGRSHCLHL